MKIDITINVPEIKIPEIKFPDMPAQAAPHGEAAGTDERKVGMPPPPHINRIPRQEEERIVIVDEGMGVAQQEGRAKIVAYDEGIGVAQPEQRILILDERMI